jgi:hypothetical protein
MQDNDFEKQVHQKMGELRLLPSEAVWEQVEMRLHRKERKRWIIWFPLLLTGLTLAGYFVINTGHLSNLKLIHAATDKSAQKKINNNVSRPTSDKPLTLNGNQEASSTKRTNSEKIFQKAHENISIETQTGRQRNINNSKQKFYHPDKLITTAISSSSSNINKLVIKNSTASKTPQLISSDSFVDSHKNKFQQYAQEEKTDTSFNTKERVLEDDKELLQSDVKEVPLIASHVNTLLISIKENPFFKVSNKLQNQRRRWEWGLSLQVGRSSLTHGTFNKSFSSGGALNSSSPIFSATNFNQSANTVYREPYPTRASAGFSAGAFMKKNLSGRFTFSFGFNYTLYSTSTTVGKKVDSLLLLRSAVSGNVQELNKYFRIGSAGSYINKYHYIEVPIVLQTRLTKSWKVPLYWDVGFSLSRLIASNALYFDSNTGVYYKDNQLLNKTHFNIITGLPVKLFAGKKFQLQAGPQLQYSFSNILANQISPEKHFLFLGLKANLVPGEK